MIPSQPRSQISTSSASMMPDRLVTILVLAVAQAAAIGAMLSGRGSLLAYQITVEAVAVGFTAIFVMLHPRGPTPRH